MSYAVLTVSFLAPPLPVQLSPVGSKRISCRGSARASRPLRSGARSACVRALTCTRLLGGGEGGDGGGANAPLGTRLIGCR
ncbi:hypothetical protein QQF64_000390 [Cirrhinus molitorella]|uniref:Uncharacterized protein n=1 Tax=Cirrhinus molitorella TaxID=172907 RepID=A0ABR3NXL8_9TELE